MYLLITIDTEGDDAWAGKGCEDNTENARYLPRFHRLCRRFGFKPTYLTTYEMASDDYFVDFARAALGRGECEIGAHPHAWNQPPHFAVTDDDTWARPYLIEYPEHIMEQKVQRLTDLLTERFDVPIRSHRAGRWAMNGTYARILARHGYTVDCSVTPYSSVVVDRPAPYEVKVALPDYAHFPDTPYFLDEHDISRRGDLPVLELPMTVVPSYSRTLSAVYPRIPSSVGRRLVRGLMGQPFQWFRPTRKNSKDMFRVAEHKLKDGSDYIMFMLHSSEFMPGANPMFRSYYDIEKLYIHLESLFHMLRQRGVKGATCAEYGQYYVDSLRDTGRAQSAPSR